MKVILAMFANRVFTVNSSLWRHTVSFRYVRSQISFGEGEHARAERLDVFVLKDWLSQVVSTSPTTETPQPQAPAVAQGTGDP